MKGHFVTFLFHSSTRVIFIIAAVTIIFLFQAVSKSDGEGNGTPLQYSCLENPMDGGGWWAAVHGVVKSRTRLSDLAAAAVLLLNEFYELCCP